MRKITATLHIDQDGPEEDRYVPQGVMATIMQQVTRAVDEIAVTDEDGTYLVDVAAWREM